MMSFRHAEDHTYIAQLLGRMIRTPLARRIDRNAALNDVHLFLPYFDAKAVDSVVNSLQNIEAVPPAETGSSRELVILGRREGSDEAFAALSELITYRVNAARAQSHVRRLMAISRNLTLDGIDSKAWDLAKSQLVQQMKAQIALLRSSGEFLSVAQAITRIVIRTLVVQDGVSKFEPDGNYDIEASELDVDRLFDEAGRVLSNALHSLYWQENADRKAIEVKVEAIVLSRSHQAMVALEQQSETSFDAVYDANKKAISKLTEQRRGVYEKLRLATAKPTAVE